MGKAGNMADLSEPLTAGTADPLQHRQELTERLDTLRRNDSFCDVTVAVKDKEFKAHKDMLAASSPFFLSLLKSDMRESNEQLIRIELEEATPAVMEEVLKYIYTGMCQSQRKAPTICLQLRTIFYYQA